MERHYYIYWIEDEFAHHYLVENLSCFICLNRYTGRDRSDDELVMLVKQVDYVTKRIPAFHMHQRLMNNLTNIHYTHNRLNIQCIAARWKRHSRIHYKRPLHSNVCHRQLEAEAVFFEVLKKISPCFLAMDFWIKRSMGGSIRKSEEFLFKKIKIEREMLYNSLLFSTLYTRQHEGGRIMDLWVVILVGVVATACRSCTRILIARKYMMSYLKKNPPIMNKCFE